LRRWLTEWLEQRGDDYKARQPRWPASGNASGLSPDGCWLPPTVLATRVVPLLAAHVPHRASCMANTDCRVGNAYRQATMQCACCEYAYHPECVPETLPQPDDQHRWVCDACAHDWAQRLVERGATAHVLAAMSAAMPHSQARVRGTAVPRGGHAPHPPATLGSTATYACLLANTFGEAAAPAPGARQAVDGEVAGGARSAAVANTGRMLEVGARMAPYLRAVANNTTRRVVTMLRLGCNLLPGAFGHTAAVRAETSTCRICGVTLDPWHLLVECRVYDAERRRAIALADSAAAADQLRAVQRRLVCMVPPLDTICLDTEHGRWQFFCLCLGGRWDVNPMPATALVGNGPDARRYRNEEATWQRHFNTLEPNRQGRGPRFSGDKLRSALGTAVYPALMRFAEFAYRDACAAHGIELNVAALPGVHTRSHW
jgi:hypothetical protein